MMKWLKNQKGSIPMAVIAITLLGMVVMMMTELLISEQAQEGSLSKVNVENVYKNDFILETVQNVTLQKLMSKEWNDDIENEYVLSQEDLSKIETDINKVLLPTFNKKATITLGSLKSPRVYDSCDMIYGVDTTGETEEQYIDSFVCYAASNDIEFTINVNEKGKETNYLLSIRNLTLVTIENDGKIVVDKSSMIIDLK